MTHCLPHKLRCFTTAFGHELPTALGHGLNNCLRARLTLLLLAPSSLTKRNALLSQISTTMADMNDDALVEPLGEPLAPQPDLPAADPFVPDELDDNGEQHEGINDHDVDDEPEDGDEEDPVLDEAQRANVLIATTLPIKFRQKHGPHGQARTKLIALKSLLRGIPGVISVVKQGIRDVPEFRVTFTNRMLGETALDHLSTEGFIVCGDTKYTPLYGAKHANLVSYDVRDCPFDANDNPTSMGFAAPDFDAVALLRDYVTTDHAWTRNLEVKFTTPGPAQYDGTLNVSTSVIWCSATPNGLVLTVLMRFESLAPSFASRTPNAWFAVWRSRPFWWLSSTTRCARYVGKSATSRTPFCASTTPTASATSLLVLVVVDVVEEEVVVEVALVVVMVEVIVAVHPSMEMTHKGEVVEWGKAAM